MHCDLLESGKVFGEVAELARGEDAAHRWHGGDGVSAGGDVGESDGDFRLVGEDEGEARLGFLFECPGEGGSVLFGEAHEAVAGGNLGLWVDEGFEDVMTACFPHFGKRRTDV